MRAGRLDRKITLQRETSTESESGEPIKSWSNLVLRRSASYRPLRNDERRAGGQIVAGEQIEFTIRHSANVADLSPRDRIIYPALQADSPVDDIEEGRIFDIMETSEIGSGEGIRIVAHRRADIRS